MEAIAINTRRTRLHPAIGQHPARRLLPDLLRAGAPGELARGVLDGLPPDKCWRVLAPPPLQLHHPFEHPELTSVYDALRDGGVELALTGHSHAYERSLRWTPTERGTRPAAVREFVVAPVARPPLRRSVTPPPAAISGAERGGLRRARVELASDGTRSVRGEDGEIRIREARAVTTDRRPLRRALVAHIARTLRLRADSRRRWAHEDEDLEALRPPS